MRNRFKIILSIIFVLILLALIILLTLSFKPENTKKEYKVLDSIKDYDYTLRDRDYELTKNIFSSLKDVLNEDEVDYELYAEYLSKLFIVDLFTLDNKENKYDVGGIDYVYNEIKDNYRLNVEDTLYKYIIDKNSEDRETLSIVSKIEKTNSENTTYVYNNKEYNAYKINLSWDYEKDMGYPKNGEIILIKDNKKLYVVSYKGVE